MKAKSKKPKVLYSRSSYDSVLLLMHLIESLDFEVVGITFNEDIHKYLETIPDIDLVILELSFFTDEDFNKIYKQYNQIKMHLSDHKTPFILFTKDNQYHKELVTEIDADVHIKYPVDFDEVERVFRKYFPGLGNFT